MSRTDAIAGRKIVAGMAAFIVVYAAVSWLDLTTTVLALGHAGATEGNTYATDASVYLQGRALLITLAGAAMIGACFLWSALTANRIAGEWLDRPLASFGRFYINPFSPVTLDRSPLHMLSYVIAFAVLRVLAAGNNLMIAAIGWGPLGALIGMLTRHMPATFAFWIVLGPLYVVLAIAVSPVAAALARWFRAS